LRPLVKALKDANRLVHEAANTLDVQNWNIEVLQRSDTLKVKKKLNMPPPDSLDQLVAISQTLTEDIRQTSSFIQGNATLLFKRNSMTPSTPIQEKWPDDSDYVSIESSNDTKTLENCIMDNKGSSMRNNVDDFKETLDSNDKTVLLYYTTQCVTHINYLTQAIDSFLKTVERNQPPKFFLAYGKFVVLSAHNLVAIADTVHRNITKKNVKAKILSCADSLSESLKSCVLKTKKAAQQFPSVTAGKLKTFFLQRQLKIIKIS
jgi:enhancer of filamentation 1